MNFLHFNSTSLKQILLVFVLFFNTTNLMYSQNLITNSTFADSSSWTEIGIDGKVSGENYGGAAAYGDLITTDTHTEDETGCYEVLGFNIDGTGTGTSNPAIKYIIPAGTTTVAKYTFGAWVKGTDGGRVRLNARYKDGSSWSSWQLGTLKKFTGTDIDSEDWVYIEEEITTVAGLQLELRVNFQVSVAPVRVDDVTFTLVGEAPPVEEPTIAANDPRIQVEGSNYVTYVNNELVVHRHSDAVYAQSSSVNLFSPIKARSGSGIVIKFKTASPTVKVNFKIVDGNNSSSTFGVFQNDVFDKNATFGWAADSNEVLSINSINIGDEVIYKITFPIWTDIHITGIDLEDGFDLVTFSEESKPVYVAFGDSITHGRGQDTTQETYAYILSELMGVELFNVAVGGGKTSQALATMIADDFPEIAMITILIGYNDLNGEGITAEAYAARYEGVLTTLRAAHPTTKIYCINMLYTKTAVSTKTGISPEAFREEVRTIVSAKKENGDANLFLIEGGEITDANDLNGTTDPVHLSIDGASSLANKLFAEISTTLSIEKSVKKKG